jgi:hypothetical protein
LPLVATVVPKAAAYAPDPNEPIVILPRYVKLPWE